MRRTIRTSVLGAAAATGVSLLVVASGAGAGQSDSSPVAGEGGSGQTGSDAWHLVATTTAYKDTIGGKAKATNVFAYKTALRETDGDRAGRENCFCVATDPDDLVCTGILILRGGSLTYTVPFGNTTGRGTGAITGGTGKFSGATGTFKAVFRARTDPAVYDYYLRLGN